MNNASYIAIGTWEDLEYASSNSFLEIEEIFSQYGRYEDFLAQFDINVFGTIKVTRALLPHFQKRRTGTIVFIGSLSGWIGDPGCSAYAGTNFALEGKIVLISLIML